MNIERAQKEYLNARQEAVGAAEAYGRSVADAIPADRRLTDDEIVTVIDLAAADMKERTLLFSLLPGLTEIFRDAFRDAFVRRRVVMEG